MASLYGVILSQRDTYPRFWKEVTLVAERMGLDQPDYDASGGYCMSAPGQRC